MALRWFCTYDSAWTTPLCMYSSELTKRESNALALTTSNLHHTVSIGPKSHADAIQSRA
jgi:hypothetical protein